MHATQPKQRYALVKLVVAVPLDNGCPPGQEDSWVADSVNGWLNGHLSDHPNDPAIADWIIGEFIVVTAESEPEEGSLFIDPEYLAGRDSL